MTLPARHFQLICIIAAIATLFIASWPVGARGAIKAKAPVRTSVVADLSSLTHGALVTVPAVITLPPGVVGKTIFGLSDSAGTAGIYARSYGRGELPSLSPGQPVLVTGSVYRDGDRVMLHTKPSAVVISGKAAPLAFQDRYVGALGATDAALPVSISGFVAARGKRWIDVSDTDARYEVRVDFTPGEALPASPGDTIRARGVVRIKAGTTSLIISQPQDVEVTPVERPLPDPALEIGSAASDTETAWPFARPAVLLTLAASGGFLWQRQRRALKEEQAVVDR